MLTDAELHELEVLLICKYNELKFGKIYHNVVSNKIIAYREDLEQLLSINYPGRYKTFNNKVIMSLDLFNLLMMRYFPRNVSVIVEKTAF
jgi:hypothetical protein